MEERKLASIQRVHQITPIEGADRIECAHVLGWKCVVNKGEFQEGDLCIYIEVDAFLPVCERFEFLRSSSFRSNMLLGEGFRLRTQKFRGQISQGLLQPLSILPEGEYQIGDDVTAILGIKKWDMEQGATNKAFVLGSFPDDISKTGELRVQSYPELIDEFRQVKGYYISTKMDGTSVTMYWRNGRFGVCGRNVEYADDEKCAMWKYAHRHHIPEKMAENQLPNLAIQGEFCGPGIQKNPLKLARPEWYVFTVIDLETGKRFSLSKMQELCQLLELQMVPVEEEKEVFAYDDVETLLERAKGKYPSGMNKEGIVIRPIEPVFSETIKGPLSMKVLNNDYLLKV